MTRHDIIVRRPATYQDVIDAPEGMIAELVDGALHLQPRPRLRHNYAAGALFGDLRSPFERGHGGPGGWLFLLEPELHLDGDVLVPDVCGWRRERMPSLPDTHAATLAPDWVCEVLSPGTKRFDYKIKRQRYAEAGVAHLWLLDPMEDTLEAFALDGETWSLVATLGAGDTIALPPFETISIAMDDLLPARPED
ncbi:MAG: Uma2 family endonuclease [Paracoccaceae bacterium]